MSKIFRKNDGPAVDVKRNTFDLSYASHVTGNIGDIIPVMCQEVLPGDSFEIDGKFGLRFNPTAFPIQTKVHGVMHYWYVRNRNLMDKWPEYITRTDSDVVMPYLDITEANAKDLIGTGTLGDYLGVPSTVTGDYAHITNHTLLTTLSANEAMNMMGLSRGAQRMIGNLTGFSDTALSAVNTVSPRYLLQPITDNSLPDTLETLNNWLTERYHSDMNSAPLVRDYYQPMYNMQRNTSSLFDCYGYLSGIPVQYPVDVTSQNHIRITGCQNLGNSELVTAGGFIAVFFGDGKDDTLYNARYRQLFQAKFTYKQDAIDVELVSPEGFNSLINGNLGQHSIYLGVMLSVDPVGTTYPDNVLFQTKPPVLPTDSAFKLIGRNVLVPVSTTAIIDATETSTVTLNPFVKHAGETTPKIKLNALPWRGYQAIVNYAYRDETVDPFIKDGKPCYNDFITTHADGLDSTSYAIAQRNWERDYYTSCQASPQQGEAPLVGISASGEFTFSDGTNEYTATATIGDDGKTITGISTYDPSMPKGSLRQMMDIVTNGFDINTLRNVGALQRWLETNIRRGYKYVDQIYSHFGVTPGFKENDCPEFLGGCHVVGDVNQINNYSGEGLGEYAGQLSMFGGSNNKARKFFDEAGYVYAVLMVFPEPTYSQMLPKHFLKTQTPLDYYFPEFGHIGYQPITYNEVTPLEVAASDVVNGTDTINDTFGYQRAWADYLANVDEVHGDFRTSLSQFVISRVFSQKPELGHDFIAIDHNDIDDVFVSQDGSNKFLGEIRFDIKAQRPIPLYGIPQLIA